MVLQQSADLAEFCANVQARNLSPAVLERVRFLLLDHLAVTLRGSLLPSSQAVYQMVTSAAGKCAREATIFGRSERAEACWAALANGTAAHALGMDDVERHSSLHPGAVIFPAVLALTEQEKLSDDDFYAAVVAGYEVTLRIGAALLPASVYERGFHPTAICGALGAAAACARLLNLSAEQINMALGIAGSMAAGSMAYLQNGAWTKSLHAGWACHAGITAARLASGHFIGPSMILEGKNNFLQAHSSESNLELLQRFPESEYALMQVSLKPYACCRYTHGPIDCLFQIRRAHQIDLTAIRRISCGVLSAGRSLIADPLEQKQQSASIIEAQSSMPFCAALALVTGQASISVFTEEWLAHPLVRSLMQRVECYSSSDLDDYYPDEWRAAVSVEMNDGQQWSASVRYALGDPGNPLSLEQLEERFHQLTAPVLPNQQQREHIIQKVRHLKGVGRTDYFMDEQTQPDIFALQSPLV